MLRRSALSQQTASAVALAAALSSILLPLAADAAGGEPFPSPPPAPSSAVEDVQSLDASLAQTPTLEAVLRVALAKNPDLSVARARVQAAVAAGKAASRLPDPELKTELWAVPLARPFALNEADTIMVGLQQAFPAFGSRAARARAGEAAARGAESAARARELDIAQEVRRTYFTLFRFDREYHVHLEHVQLAAQVLDLVRLRYRTGAGNQQDVLRANLYLTRLHNDVFQLEQELTTARALLNALMARPAQASLGSPVEPTAPQLALEPEALEQKLLAQRPDLASSAQEVARAQAEAQAAKRAATWPSVMVGADYWYMPTRETRHAYGGMLTFSLPWLNPRHRDEVHEAERNLAAGRASLESVRNTARFALREALARVSAAQASHDLVERELLPQARQGFEAARAAFGAGQGTALELLDAARSYLDVRLERIRSLTRLSISAAELERVVGADVFPPSQSSTAGAK